MIRRRHGHSLSRAQGGAEDMVDPNSYITNIADCMLVLVLGLLVALVSRYGVDLQNPDQSQDKVPDMTGVEVDMDENQDGVIDDRFAAGGTVYYDTVTGNYYYVSEQ